MKREDTGIWEKKLYIALCTELALEKAVRLSQDMLRNECLKTITVIHNSPEIWRIHMLDANIFKEKTKCGANIVHSCTFRESYMEREKIQQYHEYGRDRKKRYLILINCYSDDI
jgi:hypothetical protein